MENMPPPPKTIDMENMRPPLFSMWAIYFAHIFLSLLVLLI